MAWKLYDFIDEEGRSAIALWMDALDDARVRARLDAKVASIRSAGLNVLPNMVTPTTENRIKEIVLNGKAGAFRIFLTRGPGSDDLTLLGGGQEKDTKYQTKGQHITPEQAEQRRVQLFANLPTRRRPHEFAEDNLG